jgi:hypothetical protein
MWAMCYSNSRNLARIAQPRSANLLCQKSVSGVQYYSRQSWHGIGVDLHIRELADTKLSQRCPGASRIYKLLLNVYLEVCQCDSSTSRTTKEG